jgi:YVTN family beta-propeller protein
VDPHSHTVRTFGSDSTPLDLAADGHVLWIVGGQRGPDSPYVAPPASLTGVDDASGDTLASTSLPPAAGQSVRGPPQLAAVAGGGVWAIGRTGWLQRLDIASGRTRVLRGIEAYWVASGDGQLWTLRSKDPEKPGFDLLRLDPRTGRVISRVEMPSYVGPLAIGSGAVWLADGFGGVVWRVDPGPRPTLRTVTVGPGVDSIAAGDGAVWAANSLTGTLSRIDPATNRVTARIAVGGTPRSIAVGAGRVWVAVAGEAQAAPTGGSLRADAKVKPVDQPGCGPVLTGPGGDPDLLIVTDLPGRGAFATTTQPMAAAVAFALREHGFRAGRFRVGLQSCDDSLAATGQPDGGKCASNAKAYAGNPRVIGVVGPMHSFCSEAMLPTLNRARGGPVALVSPTNTVVGLVRAEPGMPPDALRQLYPTGQRGYARVATGDDHVMDAVARVADRLGRGRVFYLADKFLALSSWSVYFRR